MNLVPSQINEHINGAHNVNNKTLGWGMTFMHETLHSNVADGGASGHDSETTNFGSRGTVVDRMNIVRSQLNAQGMNYGQRESYISVPDSSSVTPTFLPFDKTSLSNLKNGNAPASNTMYIQIN